MKLNVNRNTLSDVLQKVQSIVERKSTMPILSNVLIRARGGKVEILATDLEVAIKDVVKASISEEGGMAVEARKVYEIVGSLPEDEISISTSKGRMEIRGRKTVFSLVGLSEEDYPQLPPYSEEDMSTMDGDLVKEMLDKTTFAASTDESRYNLRGVFFEKDKDEEKIRMVATDGHRLSLISKDHPGVPIDTGVIIPRKGVNELRKLLSKGGSLKFGIKENNAIFITDTTVLITRLIDSDFPDYRQVLPKSEGDPVIIERDSFLSALKRVSIIIGGLGGVKLHIESGTMVVSTSNPDLGTAKEEVEVEYDGSTKEIILNPKYLIEPLSIFNCEKVTLGMRDPLSPVTLKPIEAEDYLYIVMPMRG